MATYIALTNIMWSDQGMSSGPPTSSYTGAYATNQTHIPKGGIVPSSVPSNVVTQWVSWGLVQQTG